MTGLAFMIRRIFEATECVVEFVMVNNQNKTVCPVCRAMHLPPGRVVVDRTVGEVRYCTCEQCLATFRAIGQTRAEIAAEMAAIPDPLKIKRSAGKKKGKGR